MYSLVLNCPDILDPLDFIDGKILESPSDTIKLSLSPRSSKYRGCIIGGLVTLFHKVFIDELKRLGIENIQYFPVELENPEGEIENTYSLVNVIGLLEAVDEGASIIKPRAHRGKRDSILF